MQFTIVFDESCDAGFTSSNHSLQELATAEFATLRLLENRCPRRRDQEPHSPCVCRHTSRSRPDPRIVRRAAAVPPLTGGVRRRSPNPSLKARCKVQLIRRWKAEGNLYASSEQMCGQINRTKKMHSHERTDFYACQSHQGCPQRRSGP